MKNKPKISIIIPVYNCEKYIERCIRSILVQTYKNLEIIVINDGSTDNTLNILNKIKKDDERIIVISKNNTGVSDTRNLGLNKASGEYIGFVDSDDYIEKEMYEDMIQQIVTNNADISICSYYDIVNNQKKEETFPWNDKIKIFKGKDVNEKLLPHYIYKLKNETNSIFGTVWRMLIKSDIAKKIKFEKDIPIAEDLIYIIDCFSLCKCVVTLNMCLYNYIEYKNSSMRKYKPNLYSINKLVHKALISKLSRVNFFESNKIRYQLNRCYMYTSSISNIVKNDKDSFFKKRNNIKKLILEFNQDKYMSINIISELEISRKLMLIFMKMRLYTMITVLFILKNYYSRRE